MTNRLENLGPAERILQALLTHSDHLHHGRPGVCTTDPTNAIGVRWQPAVHRVEEGQTVIYLQHKKTRQKLGVLNPVNKQVVDGGRNVGSFRRAGLFPEVAASFYEQIAAVWEIDNEFAARWASYAFSQDNKDLKMALAAFMLCQSRVGAPVVEDGKRVFDDEDYRDVGEAMLLIHRKDGKGIDPKYLLRMHDFLSLPKIAEINRRLGFGKSTRRNFVGRWTKVIHKWLAYREANPKVLEGLVKSGYRQTVMELCRRSGYKPETPAFFEALRWKQKQAQDGRRELAIGQTFGASATEIWKDLNEQEICRAITKEKPSWKRVVGLLGGRTPTRAMLAATIDAGGLSDKDLIIMTPTLEAEGLLAIQNYRVRHEQALRKAEDMRAVNIAKNVRSEALKEKLQAAADTAIQKKVEVVTRNLRTYFFVDVSGSMTAGIADAKAFLSKLVVAFPLDRIHVFTFNTVAKAVTIKVGSTAGVENAFKGISADGGTVHKAAIRKAAEMPPAADEDVLFIFVGDEGEGGDFADEVRASKLRPTAFGLIKVGGGGTIVADTAAKLKIPCLKLTKETFADPYALPRMLPDLIAATPVGAIPTGYEAPKRETLVETILKCEILQKPAWAA